MEPLYTTKYDNDLQSQLPHLQNYPELLPFIGNKWNESKLKILLIAESHYIATKDIQKEQLENWYDYSSADFKKYESDPFQLHNYINTRLNVTRAETEKYSSPYVHYYNMKNAIRDNIPEFKNIDELVYPYFAYYNYFQRPAYTEGASIINKPIDDEKAYNTFKVIIDTIQPNKIIFTSNKSFNTYQNSRNKLGEQSLFSDKIYSVPHPGSAWWNRRSKKYGKDIKTNQNKTGKKLFIDIITSKI